MISVGDLTSKANLRELDKTNRNNLCGHDPNGGSSFPIPDITNRPLQDPADELYYRFFFLVNSALVFINPALSVPGTPESTTFAAAIPGSVKLVPDTPGLTKFVAVIPDPVNGELKEKRCINVLAFFLKHKSVGPGRLESRGLKPCESRDVQLEAQRPRPPNNS